MLKGYYVIIHVLGIIVLVPWILRSVRYGKVVSDDAVGKVWWGVYTAMTCFNDVGAFPFHKVHFLYFSQVSDEVVCRVHPYTRLVHLIPRGSVHTFVLRDSDRYWVRPLFPFHLEYIFDSC